MNCPCQSGQEYELCCGRFISQRQVPENAEQLMRSRYTAYALGHADYLRQTWHEDFRPLDVTPDSGIKWLKLKVLDSSALNDTAVVEFEASFLLKGRVEALHERSRFRLENGSWLYTDGDLMPATFSAWKPGRNETCPCNSGLKFKRCCGR